MSCRIVFFEFCGGASRFGTQVTAETAAEQYSKKAGYVCEAFLCGKTHDKPHSRSCWHVRGRRQLCVPTGTAGRQFTSTTLSPEQLDAALACDIEEVLSGIPE